VACVPWAWPLRIACGVVMRVGAMKVDNDYARECCHSRPAYSYSQSSRSAPLRALRRVSAAKDGPVAECVRRPRRTRDNLGILCPTKGESLSGKIHAEGTCRSQHFGAGRGSLASAASGQDFRPAPGSADVCSATFTQTPRCGEARGKPIGAAVVADIRLRQYRDDLHVARSPAVKTSRQRKLNCSSYTV